MKKNTLFLAAAITTFTLVLLAGVLRAGASVSGSEGQAVIPTNIPTLKVFDTATMQPTDTATIQPINASVITPQDAAFIAGSALGNTKIFSVDTVTRYGMDVYKVTFTSGSIVYVSPQGHILTITSLQTVVTQPASGQQSSSNNSPAPTSQPSGSDDGGDNSSGGDD